MTLHHLFSTYVFLIPLIVGLSAEALKVVTEGFEHGKWYENIFRPGGMPSSHSALVMSLLIIVGYRTGMGSVLFAVTFVFASIVWYDAMSSRRAIGKQAEILNRLQQWEHFSERLGHSFKEVLGGIVYGAAVTALGIWMAA